MNYASFLQRLAASLIDFVVILPLVFVEMWLESTSRMVAMGLLVPMTMVYLAYPIYFHGRFGQTIGKRKMGIRVERTSGESIGWREAWLRSSVDVAFSILRVVSSFVALAAISDAQYYNADWMQRSQTLQALEPAWLAWTGAALLLWTWSEVVVMLFNKRRRALHDFIAGTVVTSERRALDPQTPGIPSGVNPPA